MKGTPLPGLALAAALAALALVLAGWIGADLLGYARSPISPVLVAVLLGLAVRNTVGVAATFEPGVRLCITRVLRVSVALLGIRLSLAAAGTMGLSALPVVTVTIAAAIIIVTGLTRLFALPRRLGTLIAVGTAICGITAIVATAPVIGADEDETSYAVGTIAIFGMLAMLAYPFLAYEMFGDPHNAGLFLGTAIHDTSQVAGAALAYAQQFGAPVTLETATVTKLIRNLSMALVIPLLGVMYQRRRTESEIEADGGTPTDDSAGARIRRMVPLFIIGFVAMTALRSIGDLGNRPFGVLDPGTWEMIIAAAERASEIGLLIAMAAVGLGTGLARMRTLGLRPLAMGMAAAATVGAVSWGMIAVTS
jgi:uncharacterized integral membrane protein (TIGR00698 family)